MSNNDFAEVTILFCLICFSSIYAKIQPEISHRFRDKCNFSVQTFKMVAKSGVQIYNQQKGREQNNWKSCGRILMKLSGDINNGTINIVR